MTSRTQQWLFLSGGVAFVSLTAAIALAFAARNYVSDDAGTIVLLVLAIVFGAALIVFDVVLVIDKDEGNTFSELLRSVGREATIFPWTFAVFAGRWFHPVDGVDLLGVAGVLILMGATMVMIVIGSLVQRGGGELPSFVVVVIGFVSGSVLWPVNA